MDLRNNILATLAYYDVFDRPLRAEEIFRFLVDFRHLGENESWNKHEAGGGGGPFAEEAKGGVVSPEFTKSLDGFVFDGLVGSCDGYYFLFGKEYLIPLRFKREKIANKKLKKAKRYARIIRLLPFVKAIFASGSLAMSNTDELSDLDVLVVVESGHIWSARFFISVLLSVFGLRRKASDVLAPDKICLNHYITDKSLLINYPSIYNAQTYANLVPLFVCNSEMVKKFKEKNNWVLEFVNQWNIDSGLALGRSFLSDFGNYFLRLSGLGAIFEKLSRRYQYRRISKNPATKNSGGRVIFGDEQLEFHPQSIETKIIEGYNNRLNLLGLTRFAKEIDSGLVR